MSDIITSKLCIFVLKKLCVVLQPNYRGCFISLSSLLFSPFACHRAHSEVLVLCKIFLPPSAEERRWSADTRAPLQLWCEKTCSDWSNVSPKWRKRKLTPSSSWACHIKLLTTLVEKKRCTVVLTSSHKVKELLEAVLRWSSWSKAINVSASAWCLMSHRFLFIARFLDGLFMVCTEYMLINLIPLKRNNFHVCTDVHFNKAYCS